MTRYLRVYGRDRYHFVLIDEGKDTILFSPEKIYRAFRLFQDGVRDEKGVFKYVKDEGVQSVTPLAFFMIEE